MNINLDIILKHLIRSLYKTLDQKSAKNKNFIKLKKV